MTKLILETEYSIKLAASYAIESPYMKEDWLCICLYYDEIFGMVEADKDFNQNLIKCSQYPLEEITKKNYTGATFTHPNEVNLNLIRYATENEFHFIPDLERIEREDFINFVNDYLVDSISTLRKSFFTFDLIKYFVLKNLPTISGRLSKELENKLISFKASDFGNAFKDGINDTIEKYSKYYYVTGELEQQLKTEFIEAQQEFLSKLDFEKVKQFKFSSILEDGIGTAANFLIPFLPLGTLIELFNFTKTQIDFKQNSRLQFILSILILQKILQEEIKPIPTESCFICQTTEAEINNLDDDKINEFLSGKMTTMCVTHMIGYLNARKFGNLTGKSLLLTMKH